jgi:hypothetical protein
VSVFFANVGAPRAAPVAGPSGELTNVYSPVGTLKRYVGCHWFFASAVSAWEVISVEDEDKSPVRRDTVKWIGLAEPTPILGDAVPSMTPVGGEEHPERMAGTVSAAIQSVLLTITPFDLDKAPRWRIFRIPTTPATGGSSTY